MSFLFGTNSNTDENEQLKNELKELIFQHFKETNSIFAKKLLNNFENEVINFFQVCPKEMIDKLENPLTLDKSLGVAS